MKICSLSEEGLFFLCVQKKLSAVAKNLFFVEVIWLGGVSSISGTPNGVCREPFPTSYNFYIIYMYIICQYSLIVNIKFFQPVAMQASLDFLFLYSKYGRNVQVIVFNVKFDTNENIVIISFYKFN